MVIRRHWYHLCLPKGGGGEGGEGAWNKAGSNDHKNGGHLYSFLFNSKNDFYKFLTKDGLLKDIMLVIA